MCVEPTRFLNDGLDRSNLRYRNCKNERKKKKEERKEKKRIGRLMIVITRILSPFDCSSVKSKIDGW